MSKRRTSRIRRNERKTKSRPIFTGKVQMTRDGFIFVVIEGQEDVFVKASKTRQALPTRGQQPPPLAGPGNLTGPGTCHAHRAAHDNKTTCAAYTGRP